jgi:hypothetical protein
MRFICAMWMRMGSTRCFWSDWRGCRDARLWLAEA